ncbi:MAG TPA: alkaline phosphatase D family protein [Solimonas sp.]|nr:alkaline phosphatase D family protein [Solimonas sp.]
MHHDDIDARRRRLLLASAGLFALGNSACATRPVVLAPTADPFTLGIASGDPEPDGFVIWTRLAPQPLQGGGMPQSAVEVSWEVAHDEGFQRIVSAGTAVAEPAWAHSVHVEVQGLAPDRWYWYRFRWGDARSPVGRSRTAPAAGATLASLRFAYASCQHYEQGYYSAYRHLVADHPDLVLHLGDYIYESSSAGGVRQHEAGEPHSLADYRNRHACYKLDADLRAAHAACPWLLCWDDHEVDNDYAGTHGQDEESEDRFLLRRAAAYQAYWEHMPLRRYLRPTGPSLLLYQRSSFGDLVGFHVLDTRQYRSDQACGTAEKRGGQVVTQCEALRDPAQTMLGPTQENWFLHGLGITETRWNFIAQSMLMAPLDQAPGPEYGSWTDGWDGYPAARERILRQLAGSRTPNPVVIGGDIHSFWATELSLAADAPPVATEFTGSSISSNGVPYERFAAMLPENPHVKFFDSRKRGYVMCELVRERLDVAFRVVDDVRDAASGASTLARFVVENGQARVLPG